MESKEPTPELLDRESLTEEGLPGKSRDTGRQLFTSTKDLGCSGLSWYV